MLGVQTAQEANYRVVREDGHFEIRNYEGYAVVETQVNRNFDETQKVAFLAPIQLHFRAERRAAKSHNALQFDLE